MIHYLFALRTFVTRGATPYIGCMFIALCILSIVAFTPEATAWQSCSLDSSIADFTAGNDDAFKRALDWAKGYWVTFIRFLMRMVCLALGVFSIPCN